MGSHTLRMQEIQIINSLSDDDIISSNVSELINNFKMILIQYRIP